MTHVLVGDAMIDTRDRIRAHTAPEINRRIDQETADRVQHYASAAPGDLTQRIAELDREWDIERVLETNASTLAFLGVVGALASSRRWLILPGIVLPFLFLHAVQGWCPPLPILRRFGVRSRNEIDREKYALKALRGDFRNVEPHTAASALQAARS